MKHLHNYCLFRVSRHLIRNMDLLRKKRKGEDEEEELVTTEEASHDDGGKGEANEEVISDVNQDLAEEHKEE